jgi:hypothetical protein
MTPIMAFTSFFAFPAVQILHNFLFCVLLASLFYCISHPFILLYLPSYFPIPHLCSLFYFIALRFTLVQHTFIPFHTFSLLSLPLCILPISSSPSWQQCNAFQVQFPIPICSFQPPPLVYNGCNHFHSHKLLSVHITLIGFHLAKVHVLNTLYLKMFSANGFPLLT